MSVLNEPLTDWVDYAKSTFEQMLERVDRAYLNAEAAAKAADERMRDREDKSIGEFVSSESLPNVHLEAIQAYSAMASALAGSVAQVQLSVPIEVRS